VASWTTSSDTRSRTASTANSSDIAIGRPGACLAVLVSAPPVPCQRATQSPPKTATARCHQPRHPRSHLMITANGCPQPAYATGGQWPAPRPHRTSR
jgi:hypothetical protein